MKTPRFHHNIPRPAVAGGNRGCGGRPECGLAGLPMGQVRPSSRPKKSPEYDGVVVQQDERPATSFRVFARESHGYFCDLQFSELVTCRLKRPLGPKNKFPPIFGELPLPATGMVVVILPTSHSQMHAGQVDLLNAD